MSTRLLLTGLIVFLLALSTSLSADTILLRTGEKFTSDKIWEEDGAIRFNMQGLIVKVNKQDVAAIIRDGEKADPLPATLPAPVIDTSASPIQFKPLTDPPPTSRSELPDDSPQTTPNFPKPLTKPERKQQSEEKIQGTGIKGLVWEMRPSEIPGLVHAQTEWDDQGIDHYVRPDEPLLMGSARLDGIVYGFWKTRLYSLMYWVAGPPGYEVLKKVVMSHYGEGTRSKSGRERYIWRSTSTDRMLEFDEKLNIGIFWMRSRKLEEQFKLDQPSAASQK